MGQSNLKLWFTGVLFAFAFGAFSQTVYITRTGTKYHSEGCGSLRSSSNAIELEEAIKKGYGPCGNCHPPTEVTPSGEAKEKKAEVKKEPEASPKPAPKKKSGSVQCSGKTKAGARCKRMTTSSNGKCYQHGG